MTVLVAVGWGAATSASLWLGQALARPMDAANRATGLIMGFVARKFGTNRQEPERLAGLEGQKVPMTPQVEKERGGARNRDLPLPEEASDGLPESGRPGAGHSSRVRFLIEIGDAQVLDLQQAHGDQPPCMSGDSQTLAGSKFWMAGR